MTNLKLGQDVSNKRESKQTAAHIVAKSYPLQQAEGMRRYGSLIKINPSDLNYCCAIGKFWVGKNAFSKIPAASGVAALAVVEYISSLSLLRAVGVLSLSSILLFVSILTKKQRKNIYIRSSNMMFSGGSHARKKSSSSSARRAPSADRYASADRYFQDRQGLFWHSASKSLSKGHFSEQ